MAGRERHPVEFTDVPRAHEDAAGVRVVAQQVDGARDLVDVPAVGRRPGPPLASVHRAEFALPVRPLVPDRYALFLERVHVGLAAQEPQQFLDHGLDVHAFRRDQRKARGQVETQLPAEHGQGAGAGAVRLARAALAHVA